MVSSRGQQGMSLVAVIVAVALFAIVAKAGLSLTRDSLRAHKSALLRSELFHIQRYFNETYSCEATTGQTCVNGYVAVKNADGDVILGLPTGSQFHRFKGTQYLVRARCKACTGNGCPSGATELEIEALHTRKNSVEPARNPLTRKLSQWTSINKGIPSGCQL